MNNITENSYLSNIQFAALEAAANGIVITDKTGAIIWVNPAMEKLTGYSADEMLGHTPKIISSGQHSEEFYRDMWQTILSGKAWRGDVINRRKDGSLYYEDMTITPVFSKDGEIQNFIAIKQDITRYRQAVEALTESEERFRQLINSVNAHFYAAELIPDEGFEIIYISEHIEKLTGYPREKIAQNFSFWQSLIHPDDLDISVNNMKRLLSGESVESEYRIVDAVGIIKWVRDDVNVVVDGNGKMHLYGTITDITERRETEDRIRHLATHDPLTNLPNRIMFREILEHAMTLARRNNFRAAVFFLDVDNFKDVNDTYGHQIGDALLQSIAERLSNNLRKHDTISRISGDEFTLVTEQLKSAQSAYNVAEKIHALLEGTYQLGEHSLRVSVSVGGSIYPDHAEDYETLIRMADAAMYQAKKSPDQHYIIHQPEELV